MRKILSLLLVLTVAMAPVRFGYAAAGQGVIDKVKINAGALSEHMAMPGCKDMMEVAGDTGCFLMGESDQGGDGCQGSDCNACPGAQSPSLTPEVLSASVAVSPIYTLSQRQRLPDTPAAADYRPPRNLS